MFDFDETLAKVHFNKRELPKYDDQVDILTKDKTLSVRYACFTLCRFLSACVLDLRRC